MQTLHIIQACTHLMILWAGRKACSRKRLLVILSKTTGNIAERKNENDRTDQDENRDSVLIRRNGPSKRIFHAFKRGAGGIRRRQMSSHGIAQDKNASETYKKLSEQCGAGSTRAGKLGVKEPGIAAMIVITI
jgi:hypothetical protein